MDKDLDSKLLLQLWEYTVNGQLFTTPSGAYATDRDPNATLIYEQEYD